MKCGVKCDVRPAVKLRQIFEIDLMNTAGLMNCGVEIVTPAVGLRQIFEINLINTAGLTRMKCGAKACLDPLYHI
jgi:hypothetical protein